LHYDLRLERGGVLKSWAVPKGLPPRPGIKRLAVSVEDHPLEYVNFEGAIPKGEYGGGMMWKFAQGRYQITKEKKDGFYFRLQSRELNAEYRTHHTKENQWLLERVDNPQTDIIFPQFRSSSAFGFQEEALLNQYNEKLTGVTDLALGRQPNRVGATRTATGVASLLSESGLRFKIFMTRFQEFWRQIFEHVLALDQQYLPPGKVPHHWRPGGAASVARTSRGASTSGWPPPPRR
jgi:hypothetical protein